MKLNSLDPYFLVLRDLADTKALLPDTSEHLQLRIQTQGTCGGVLLKGHVRTGIKGGGGGSLRSRRRDG
jgi:hypothetical protein